MNHCKNCNQITGSKRNIGIGTVIACVLTAGWWLFLIPFYRKNKCVMCGSWK